MQKTVQSICTKCTINQISIYGPGLATNRLTSDIKMLDLIGNLMLK